MRPGRCVLALKQVTAVGRMCVRDRLGKVKRRCARYCVARVLDQGVCCDYDDGLEGTCLRIAARTVTFLLDVEMAASCATCMKAPRSSLASSASAAIHKLLRHLLVHLVQQLVIRQRLSRVRGSGEKCHFHYSYGSERWYLSWRRSTFI